MDLESLVNKMLESSDDEENIDEKYDILRTKASGEFELAGIEGR